MKNILNWIKYLWLKFASVVSWFNTRLLLCLIFYLIFTPTGLLLRLFGFDPLGKKLNKTKDSYWEDSAPVGNYEKQF